MSKYIRGIYIFKFGKVLAESALHVCVWYVCSAVVEKCVHVTLAALIQLIEPLTPHTYLPISALCFGLYTVQQEAYVTV